MSKQNNVIVSIIVIIIAGVLIYWGMTYKKQAPVEDPNSLSAIDESTRNDTTEDIDDSFNSTEFNFDLESDLNNIDAEINKL